MQEASLPTEAKSAEEEGEERNVEQKQKWVFVYPTANT